MKTFLRVLPIVTGLEVFAAVTLCALRLNATRPLPPVVPQSLDEQTGAELLQLPSRFLFDSRAKWLTLGEAYMAHGYFAKAEACLGRALAYNTGRVQVAYLRGLCQERLGLLSEARASFAEVINKGPVELRALAWHHVGRVQLRREHPEAAADAFRMAGEAHHPSLYERAKLIVRGGRPREAERMLRILLQHYPNDLRVWQLQQRAAAAWNNAAEAAAANDAAERGTMELVLDDTESRLEAWRLRLGVGRELEAARQRMARGMFAAAAARYRQIIERVHGWENHHHLLLEDAAYVHLQAGDTRRAAEFVARQFEQKASPTAFGWELRGELAARSGNTTEALAAWNTSLMIRPVAGVHAKMADLLDAIGHHDVARDHRARAQMLRGAAHFRANQFQEAVELLKAAVGLNAALADAWYYLGEAERALGHYTLAHSAFRRCIALAPHHGRAWARLEADGV